MDFEQFSSINVSGFRFLRSAPPGARKVCSFFPPFRLLADSRLLTDRRCSRRRPPWWLPSPALLRGGFGLFLPIASFVFAILIFNHLSFCVVSVEIISCSGHLRYFPAKNRVIDLDFLFLCIVCFGSKIYAVDVFGTGRIWRVLLNSWILWRICLGFLVWIYMLIQLLDYLCFLAIESCGDDSQ